MARNLNIDTERQEFLKESYKKEGLLRNKWFQGYFGANALPDGMGGPPSTSPEPAAKVAKPTFIKVRPAPPTPTPKKIHPVLTAETVGGKFSEMRAVSPGTQAMVYNGLSSEGDGRKSYLLKRKTVGPEEKFEYPLTSSQEVGWDIKEVSKTVETRPAYYGKSRIIRDTFFAQNGVM